jgi:hypothetical protein
MCEHELVGTHKPDHVCVCPGFKLSKQYRTFKNRTKFLIPYEQLYIQSHHHHKQLIPEQYTGEYNPMYQLVYEQQVKPHPTQPPDLHPQPHAQ